MTDAIDRDQDFDGESQLAQLDNEAEATLLAQTTESEEDEADEAEAAEEGAETEESTEAQAEEQAPAETAAEGIPVNRPVAGQTIEIQSEPRPALRHSVRPDGRPGPDRRQQLLPALRGWRPGRLREPDHPGTVGNRADPAGRRHRHQR